MITDKINSIDMNEIESEILELTEYIKADDYDGAREIVDELLEKCDGIYCEDENERYFCFDSPLHFYLYDYKLSSKKMIKRSKIDYRTLYLCSAHIYYAYEEYEKAEDELRNALYWNPVDFNVFSELMNLYFKTNQENKLLIILKAMRSYILNKDMLSCYFAGLGRYYFEKQNYPVSLALYYAAEYNGTNLSTEEAIDNIIKANGQTPVPPEIEEIKEILKKDNLEYGLDTEVLTMIYDLSFELQNRKNLDGAKYCLQVLYDLTEDDKYQREIDFIENNEN